MKKYLLWVGIAAIVIGAWMAIGLKKAAESKAFEDAFAGAQMGYRWDIEPNYTGMWIGIIIAILGAAAILLHIYGRSRVTAPAADVEA